MTIPVVLISGEKNSGKDTFGAFFGDALRRLLLDRDVSHADLSGNTVKQIAFADPIKRAIGDILGVEDAVLWGNSEIKESTFVYSKSVRKHLQWFGTEVFRDTVHPDVWCHKVARDVIKADRNVRAWYITDCRFPNEHYVSKSILEGLVPLPWDTDECHRVRAGDYKVFLAKVDRPSLKGRSKDQHRSETSVSELDTLNPKRILNDGTLNDLRDKAKLYALEVLDSLTGVTGVT